MPSRDKNGRTVFAPARFLGVDGPRWFLRGVISGRAAVEDTKAEPLLQVFRDTVVVRGQDRWRRATAHPDPADRGAAGGGARRAVGTRTQPLRTRPGDHRGPLMGLLQSFKDLAKSAAEHEADEIRPPPPPGCR